MIKKRLKELQERRVIIDKEIKEVQDLKKYLSKQVYKTNMEYLLAMRDKNDIYQAEARMQELEEVKK
jgi:hypothetical protein